MLFHILLSEITLQKAAEEAVSCKRYIHIAELSAQPQSPKAESRKGHLDLLRQLLLAQHVQKLHQYKLGW